MAHDEQEAEVEMQPEQRQEESITSRQPIMVAEEEQLMS
jgi:hypothetical protein